MAKIIPQKAGATPPDDSDAFSSLPLEERTTTATGSSSDELVGWTPPPSEEADRDQSRSYYMNQSRLLAQEAISGSMGLSDLMQAASGFNPVINNTPFPSLTKGMYPAFTNLYAQATGPLEIEVEPIPRSEREEEPPEPFDLLNNPVYAGYRNAEIPRITAGILGRIRNNPIDEDLFELAGRLRQKPLARNLPEAIGLLFRGLNERLKTFDVLNSLLRSKSPIKSDRIIDAMRHIEDKIFKKYEKKININYDEMRKEIDLLSFPNNQGFHTAPGSLTRERQMELTMDTILPEDEDYMFLSIVERLNENTARKFLLKAAPSLVKEVEQKIKSILQPNPPEYDHDNKCWTTPKLQFPSFLDLKKLDDLKWQRVLQRWMENEGATIMKEK